MGLDLNGVRFLLYAKRLGVSYDHLAMLGRQSLDLTKAELKANLQSFGYSIEPEELDHIYTAGKGYAEPLFSYLGANSVHSFDASTYEGATHIHDLNQAIPSEYLEKYSAVLDGGSMEHIFNFPIAIKNCMEMLEIGGYYLGITPANNFMGHGFYQFSPELFFSIFTLENGFELVSLVAFEDRAGSTWYTVKSPEEIKGRVALVNNCPVYLLVIAKRTSKVKIFHNNPQQSDYVKVWQDEGDTPDSSHSSPVKTMDHISFRNWLKRNLPFRIRHLLQDSILGYGFNPNAFIPLDPTKKQSKPEK